MMTKSLLTLRNGETLAYFDSKVGDKTLVLIHGNFSSLMFFEPLIERMPNNVRIIAVDLRGYGDSSYHQSFNTLKELADDVMDLLDQLKVDSFDLLGWSLGGGVALELASTLKTRVKHLILVASTTHKGYPIFKKNEQGQPILGAVYETKEALASDPVQVAPMLGALATSNVEFMKYIYNLTIYTGKNKPSDGEHNRWSMEALKTRCLVDADWALANLNMSDGLSYYGMGSGRIKDITAKVLHLTGTKDVVVPNFMIMDNFNALKDQSELITYDNVGHSPFVDIPDQITNDIINFINKGE
jgi:pimeloyl-ACP methyl ester carboxylesterase